MNRYVPAVVASVFSLAVVLGPTVLAAPAPAPAAVQQTVTLNPGDTLSVSCSTSLSGTFSNLLCALEPTPSPTPVPPAPTATPPAANVGLCGESNDTWHAPVVNGCQTKHEHGDAPPAWVHTSAYHPMFTHPGNTPNENLLKHTSFKGYSARFSNVDLYVIMHLDTNPNGHTSRFHSYQMWARDASGGISYFDGWMDFGVGDSTGPQLTRFHCDNTDGIRPAIAVNDQACPGPLRFENWYPRAAGYLGQAGWMPDFGFNTSANYYTGGDPLDKATWVPTGGQNNTRRIEIAWYANRSSQRGKFFATNFGQIVSGPTAAVCGTTKTVGAKTYPVLCLEQFIAPSLGSVQFPGNAVQKSYDFTGVVNPN
jgi:hypothetical protein